MAEAYVVDAVRTPVGRRGDRLAGVHPADLGAHVIKALLARTRTDPAKVDDVVYRGEVGDRPRRDGTLRAGQPPAGGASPSMNPIPAWLTPG